MNSSSARVTAAFLVLSPLSFTARSIRSGSRARLVAMCRSSHTSLHMPGSADKGRFDEHRASVDTAIRRAGEHCSDVGACTRAAHALSQQIDVGGGSYRSIIGATHSLCAKLFIYLMFLTLGRPNGLLERLGILSRCERYRLRPIATGCSQAGRSRLAELPDAHMAHMRQPCRDHLLLRPEIPSGRCRLQFQPVIAL